MNTDATPAPPVGPNDSPPQSNPDIWLAVITAAVQTYVHLGKVTGPVTAATIESVLQDAQNHQLISPPAAASVLEFVQTSEGAALVENSATLASHAFTFINIQTATSGISGQPRTYAIADQPRTYSSSTIGDEAAAADPAAPGQSS